MLLAPLRKKEDKKPRHKCKSLSIQWPSEKDILNSKIGSDHDYSSGAKQHGYREGSNARTCAGSRPGIPPDSQLLECFIANFYTQLLCL